MREKDLERRLTEYNYPEELVSTIKTLRGAGYDAFLVGGCVRDIMLEREVVDFDIATDARPEDVIKLFRKVIPTGIKHGTVTVIEGGMEIEITTFRTESGYSDARRPDKVEFVSSIEDDLRRRDFTINAFAYDPLENEFIDLFDGVSDLSKGVIRAVGDPVERFREDGLRPLRAVRIATALGFEIEMRTLIAIGETLECFKRVAKERVLDELRKIMRAVKPSVGFEYMRETGILEIIFPELLEGYGVTQNEFHAYDIYTHSLYSADFAPIDKPLVRWAALLHDVGKARTREVREDGRVTFYNHEVVSVRMAMVMLERIRFPKKEMEYVCNLIRWHMFNYTPEWTDSAVRRFIRRVGVDAVADLFDLRIADFHANGLNLGFPPYLDEFKKRIESILEAGDAITVRDLKVDGNDVMKIYGIGPSEKVGRVLNELLSVVIDEPQKNEREYLLNLLREWAQREGDED